MNTDPAMYALNQAQRQIERAQHRAEWVKRIASQLPPDLGQFPTISNEGEAAHMGKPGAWLSFSKPYNDVSWSASDIVLALESAGWVATPHTLASYGNWRSSVYPCDVESVPASDRYGALRDCDAIAPVWVELNQHTGAEFSLFMRAPSGDTFRIKIAAPHRYRVHGNRIDPKFGREWYFDKSSVRVICPDDAYLIRNGDESIAERSHLSRAYYESPQHISGRLFWNLYEETLGVHQSHMIEQLERVER